MSELSQIDAYLITCGLAWQHFFPGDAMPPEAFVRNWIKLAGGKVQPVLDVIEKCAQLDERGELYGQPVNVVFKLLNTYAQQHGVEVRRRTDVRTQRWINNTPAAA